MTAGRYLIGEDAGQIKDGGLKTAIFYLSEFTGLLLKNLVYSRIIIGILSKNTEEK